ncbi:MAG: hypothetical protein LPH21_07465, partial [Shewanella sp.]|nr:hypothetical protein [Shewanella sp.]
HHEALTSLATQRTRRDSKEKLFFVVFVSFVSFVSFVVQSFSFKRNGNILSEQHCLIRWDFAHLIGFTKANIKHNSARLPLSG